MLPESTRCVTGSAVNMGGGKRLLLSEGWRDYSRTRWSYRSDDGRPVTLLGKFTDKNLIPVLISLLFRRSRWRRGGRVKGKTWRGACERERKSQEFEQGMDSVKGREKQQDSVTKVLDSVRGRENTSYIDKVGITHWVTLWQVNHLWSTRENTRDWGIRGWVGGGLDPIDQAYFSSSLQNRYDHKLLTGGSQASFFSFLV